MKNVTLLLPIAGKSSRFPNLRPKWMLTHPNGTFMLTESIRGLNPQKYDRIVMVALQEHEERFSFCEGLLSELADEYNIPPKSISLCLLEKETRNQAETVYEGVIRHKIEGSFVVKDCDNYFCFDIEAAPQNNFVAVSDLHQLEQVNAGNKSYVKIGEHSTISNIVEKKIIGNLFCCGAYGFMDATQYKRYYLELADNSNLYLSHVIYRMILEKHHFFVVEASDYIDWGTIEEWARYKRKFATLFIDLDGVLVKNSAQHFHPKWGTTESIKKNAAIIGRLFQSGKMTIIITTSRKSRFREITEKQLSKYNIQYHQLVMDLPSARRVLINDFSTSNPYPSASAVNLNRDADNLEEMLGSLE